MSRSTESDRSWREGAAGQLARSMLTRPLTPPSVDGERLIAVFTQLVETLGPALPPTSELVLHDLSRLPNSIVAVSGSLTGRAVGYPATDMLLEAVSSGRLESRLGYRTTLPGGRVLTSSTMVIQDVSGTAVAALCINSDLAVWEQLNAVSAAMLGVAAARLPGLADRQPAATPPDPGPGPGREAEPVEPVRERFVHDVDELASLLIRESIAEVAVPVELMRKKHKIQVVAILRGRGLFLLRDAVEMAATALHVTRFTIYNYLNELDPAEDRTPLGERPAEPTTAPDPQPNRPEDS